MNPTEFDKRLLIRKIESHRARLRLEVAAVRRQIRPASLLVGWSKRWVPLSRSIDTLTRMVGIDQAGRWGRWARYASLAALALPLIKFVLGRDR